MQKINWDKLMSTIYDYVFEVSDKQFKSFKKTNFKGTYLVHWKNGKVTKEKV